MTYPFDRLSVLGALFISLLPCARLSAALAVVTDSKTMPAESVQELPEAALRGYGTVSGRLYVFGGGSILEITCENEEKAKLTQAKYLSDVQLLPGVKAAPSASVEGTLEVRSQGAVAAIASANKVFIVASTSVDGLGQLAAAVLSGLDRTMASRPQVEVPMWLDKWDKYGFRVNDYDTIRMYMPKGSDRMTFDFFTSLEWLHNDAKMGLAIDVFLGSFDYGEGISTEPFSTWEKNAAEELNIPFNLRSSAPKSYGTPRWFANRYIDSIEEGAPYYVGSSVNATPDPGWANTIGKMPWFATEVNDQYLSMCQQVIRRVVHYPNLINYNYPQQEVGGGTTDMLAQWGPKADASFQKYLSDKYGTLAAVSQRWNHALERWSDVHVPELAEFEGWSADAVNIGGNWKVKRLAKDEAPPADWMKPECADGDWETVRTPGDWMMFGGFKGHGSPAVFRIPFAVSDAWIKNHSRQWLYVWDLNPWNSEIALSVNGRDVVRDKGWPYVQHWVALDVTGQVSAGSNRLALLLPEGFIGYRVYLSGEAPRTYPFLGKGDNARWVDFMDWRTACRIEGVRRGVEVIRQIDPDKPIALDAPHTILEPAREAAYDLGGMLHDTGGMAGSWQIHEVMLSQALGLPYSVEPGNGPESVEDYQNFLGRYVTEGVQSVESVTPAMSELFYDPAIRKCVEENVPITRMIGKYHAPPAHVAYFISDRDVEMLSYPWKPDMSKVLSMGYYGWYSALEYPADGVMESDFLKDRAEKYAVIIDTNTQIMDEKTVDGIERYVRNGGVFVTLGQTGRHTETEADAWPISRLTGYKVVAIDPRLADGGEIVHPGGLDDPVADNGVFRIKRWQENAAYAHELNYVNGLSLQKVAPDCRDLIKWKDGTTAAGIRPLGKGFIIDLGVVFGRNGGGFVMKKLLEDIVLWRGVNDRTPGQIYPAVIANPATLPKDLNITPGSAYILSAIGAACQTGYSHDFDGFPWAYKNVIFRYYQTNNGLYDVWALYNTSQTESRTQDLTFRDGLNPAFAFDVKAGQDVEINRDGGIPKIKDIKLSPRETRIFLTPRNNLVRAGLDWFDLQRQWWRASIPAGKPFPPVPHKLSVDLYDGWAFLPLTDKSDEEIAALAGPQTDDAKWERRPLGIWTTPGNQLVRHGLLRRWVEVPKNWDKGAVKFWLAAWYMRTFYDEGWVYIDGVKQPQTQDFMGVDMTGIFKPGTRHLIAIEVKSDAQMTGVAGNCWLYYTPEPVGRTSLAGEWISSSDMIHDGNKVSLPGKLVGESVRRDDVMLDSAQKGRNAVLYVDSDNRILGAIVNGHWVGGGDGQETITELNITPWIKFGEPNEIVLTKWRYNDLKDDTRTLEIRYYRRGEYP